MNFLETLKENNLSFKPNLTSFAAKTKKKELEAVSDELAEIHFEKKDAKKQAETWALICAKLSQALSVITRLESAVSDTDENTKRLVEYLKNRIYNACHAVSFTKYDVHKHGDADFVLRAAIWSLNFCCHDSLKDFNKFVERLERDLK